jgi:WD40 repeat protein
MQLSYPVHPLRSLVGHQNWVKNIEYSRKDHFLATSGFDGAVYLWDINRRSEDEDKYRRKERQITLAVEERNYFGLLRGRLHSRFLRPLSRPRWR